MPDFQITPQDGAVTAIAKLNIRDGQPTTEVPVARKVEAGTSLAVAGIVTGQAVKGNDQWYAGPGRTFFWSGACSDFREGDEPPPATLKVRRRPNGTIRPLTESEIASVFGPLDYKEGLGGRIRLDPSWSQKNMGIANTPSLDDIGRPKLEAHKKAIGAFERVFAAIDAAGLTRRILTYDGLWVPRHKGWNPTRGLSSHSWAIAIDLNARWNGYGVTPAPTGSHGSVRELVPYFAAEGFAWGGFFSPPHEDGMHFELARLDL
ncbi:M15 family metallopeptidase [Bauldia litoralis]|uniref:D-alanyl-D-alanine carboxypeptidase n=1 Tax=Bauldia litoralis TaxID=665467 RepID=A0A1G6B7I2_9HYPH|nr:M15 family metallopeptidase [Bauldia litoralis]SDB16592.1 D-alanyl-D-alanine carboxypeptidase [Bauldia litoralis]